MVRMGVRELEETQKVVCSLNLLELVPGDFSSESMGHSAAEGESSKFDLQTAKIEVFEVIKPRKGASYKMRCLHVRKNVCEVEGELQLPLRVLIPHYEPQFFPSRVFQLEFDKKKSITISGAELTSLFSNGKVGKQLISLPS